jgi:replicative DNA helicase
MSFVMGKGVLIVAPIERQVAEIYQTMHKQFIDAHPEVFASSIKQDVKSPYKIVWNNGGFINFVTAGTKSGGKGDAIRGQGHGVGLIYIDECDYMTDSDLESILALPAQNPTMEVIMTSTPTGKRNMFYRLCTDPPLGWKSFHKTCWEANPEWNDTIDQEMRKVYSPDGYRREFLAEFGDEATGVFDKESIDRAMERGEGGYPYRDPISGHMISVKWPHYGYAKSLPKSPDTFRIVGVDWDKYQAGPQILIIEAERARPSTSSEYTRAIEQPFNYIKVIARQEIPRSKFSLTNAVKELVRINKDFSPDFFYVDRGYGEHQIETLQLMGLEAEEGSAAEGLDKKIIPISFSQGYEKMDPVTKQPIKVRIKPEMVNRARNKFDDEEVILNPFDDILKTQLVNYIVEKITANGEPKYSSVNEHAVDAFCLAVFGLYEQFGKKLIAEFQKMFIEKPLGQRYMELHAKRDSTGRPDFFAMHSEIKKEDAEEDIMLARSGFIKKDLIQSSPGVPTESQFDTKKQASYFMRGGSPSFSRRKF